MRRKTRRAVRCDQTTGVRVDPIVSEGVPYGCYVDGLNVVNAIARPMVSVVAASPLGEVSQAFIVRTEFMKREVSCRPIETLAVIGGVHVQAIRLGDTPVKVWISVRFPALVVVVQHAVAVFVGQCNRVAECPRRGKTAT